MVFAALSLDGPATNSPPVSRRKERLTSTQIRNRRNALMLRAVEIGLFDPLAGCVRPLLVKELPDFFNVSLPTVKRGLEDARALRKKVAEVLRKIDE